MEGPGINIGFPSVNDYAGHIGQVNGACPEALVAVPVADDIQTARFAVLAACLHYTHTASLDCGQTSLEAAFDIRVICLCDHCNTIFKLAPIGLECSCGLTRMGATKFPPLPSNRKR
ncbi:hypothetical protein D3C76_1581170 [compost metagenome]